MDRASSSQLLVFNFVMDKNHPLLSHQYEVVSELSKEFDEIMVVTGRVGKIDSLPNVKVVSTEWVNGKRLSNLVKLYQKSLPVIFHKKYNAIFFHMTDLQCALLSPLVKLLGMKQYLWYAHATQSVYLIWSYLWVNNIITSTPGSCPISRKKVLPIGQGVNDVKFRPINISSLNLNKLIHLGRFDKSKRVDLIIDTARTLKESYENIELTLVGSSSSQDSKYWADSIRAYYSKDVTQGWLKFVGSIPRDEVPSVIEKHGCFIHAYGGSLDKTLVEATMLKVPVITLNPEYCAVFGTWSNSNAFDLIDEYRALKTLTHGDLNAELLRRLAIAQSSHSLRNWCCQLTMILRQT